MNFAAHIAAVYFALSLVDVVGPQTAVSRASWHIALANGFVAFGWGLGRDEQNALDAEVLQAARGCILAVASSREVYEAYQDLQTLWLHWRLPARAPEVAGMPSANVYGL